MWEYNYTDELYHYGVKGMKWGVRKDSRAYKRTARTTKRIGKVAEKKVDQSVKMGKWVGKRTVKSGKKMWNLTVKLVKISPPVVLGKMIVKGMNNLLNSGAAVVDTTSAAIKGRKTVDKMAKS